MTILRLTVVLMCLSACAGTPRLPQEQDLLALKKHTSPGGLVCSEDDTQECISGHFQAELASENIDTGWAVDEGGVSAYDRVRRQRYCMELLMRHGVNVFSHGFSAAEQNIAYRNCLSDTARPLPFDSFSVALSGGGARSASFSMGVMKGIEELDMLQRADAISSVSGGGYTSFFYYMQLYNGLMYDRETRKNGGKEIKCRYRMSHSTSDGSDDGRGGPGKYRRYRHTDDCSVLNPYQPIAKRLDALKDKPAIRSDAFCQRVLEVNDGDGSQAGLIHNIFQTRTDADMLSVRASYQNHVSAQSDIINYSSAKPVQYLESGGLLATHILTLPVYWVTDGILDTDIYNGSVLSNAYRKGLERTYGLAPNDQFDGLVDYFSRAPSQYLNAQNGTFLFWREASQINEVMFDDMRAFMHAYNLCASAFSGTGSSVRPLPMPIINTKLSRPNSLIKDEDNHDGASLGKSVFYFTPMSWGSRYTGHLFESDLHSPFSVSKAIAVSGAAADQGAREVSGAADVAVKVVNANLGRDIRNPKYLRLAPDSSGVSRQARRVSNGSWYWFSKVIGGFPLGWLIPEESKATLRLSDGGHAENLAAYPLIERGTRRILIVDGEHDPGYTFDGLNRLLRKIETELHLTYRCGGQGCPNTGDYAEKKGPGVFEFTLTPTGAYADKREDIEVVYVKLSMNLSGMEGEGVQCAPSLPALRQLASAAQEGALPPLPCSVWHYYLLEKQKSSNAFPQNSTADIWYHPDQYRAYRDLGYYLSLTGLSRKLKQWAREVDAARGVERDLVEQYRGVTAQPGTE